MQTPINTFKQALQNNQAQIDLWLGLTSPYSTEICAGAGFDWLLIDGEHAPNDLGSTLAQLQVMAGYPGSHPIARVPMGHGHLGEALINQYLDIGVQTLPVPMVDTPAQAAALVRASRYPQYAHQANAQVCLLVQAETQTALDNLEAIAATDGIDGVFIGPADLSASMGHVANPGHPEVQKAIEAAIATIVKADKAAGILTPDETLARRYLDLGATFVAVGLDTQLLERHTSALSAKFKAAPQPSPRPLPTGEGESPEFLP